MNRNEGETMRALLTIVLFFHGFLAAFEADFDVTLVGTGPVSMIEAVYHLDLGKRVLILEAEERCGGAWKSIDVCGIRNADLGCHQIGGDQVLKEFLEKCFGCTFVSLEQCGEKRGEGSLSLANRYYFSGGCHEMISKVKAAIDARSNGVLLHRRLESIYVDQERNRIELSLGDVRYTTHKLIITPVSIFHVENTTVENQEFRKQLYPHLYILVEDSIPVRFTYFNAILPNISRAMNLTPFLSMPQTGQQLIAIQTYVTDKPLDPQKFLEVFQSKGLLTPEAKLLASEEYTYSQRYANHAALLKLGGPMIEMLDTSSFSGMQRYLARWSSVIGH